MADVINEPQSPKAELFAEFVVGGTAYGLTWFAVNHVVEEWTTSGLKEVEETCPSPDADSTTTTTAQPVNAESTCPPETQNAIAEQIDTAKATADHVADNVALGALAVTALGLILHRIGKRKRPQSPAQDDNHLSP